MNRLQLFLASFFRVFFSWFLMSLYCLSSSGSWLLVYFLLARRWPATRSAHCADHACRAWGLGFETGQCFFSPFLIAAWILSSLWSISSGVANKPRLFGTGWISFKSWSCCSIALQKLSTLSFLIAYLLLFGCALISRSSCIRIGRWSKDSAHSSLGVHLSSLWYRFSSMNVRSIVLLAVPRCHVIAPGGVASLRPPLSIAFSRHSAWRSGATW